MVQFCMKIPDASEGCPDWAIVELQGDLETKSQDDSLAGKFIGDLHFTDKGVPVLIIGHHILYGKSMKLDKPLIVIVKSNDISEEDGTQYDVKAVIKNKLIFKTRPKPIIANVPKKI